MLYKIDISMVFRHKIDPEDYFKLGLKSDKLSFDNCLPFGYRRSSTIFQRVNNVIQFIHELKKFPITNTDASIGYRLSSQIEQCFNRL